MKLTYFTFLLLLASYMSVGQSVDSTLINFDCRYLGPSVWNKADTVHFETKGSALLVTMIDYYSGTRNGPIWAVRTMHADTIVATIVDNSTQFFLDICSEYTVFQVPIDPNQGTILLKLNNKLYKIPNVVTDIDLATEGPAHIDVAGETIYLTGLNGQNGEVSLFNMEGKRSLHFEHLPASISLEGLSKGIYSIQVAIGNKSYRKAVCKQ